MDLHRKTAHELLEMYRNEDLQPSDVVDSIYSQIEENDDDIKAYITLTADKARKKAEELKEADRNLPLYGIPVAVKDNMCTAGIQTSCASKILVPFKPPYDAAAVEKIEAAGAIVIGKTNMDEFAMGSSCEHSGFFPTRNPWNTECVPGGSSGGSAAAVAADECIMALGSDTGGSIRQPASFCGITGMKPTYGAVSRYGLIAFASSLDQIGPMTKDTRDSALLMNVIAGHDPRDSTSVKRDYPDYTKALTGDIRGMKIGMVTELFEQGTGIDADILQAVNTSVDKLKELGAEVGYVDIPTQKYALTAYYLIAPAEASSNLARYDGVQYGMRTSGDDDYISMFCRTRRDGFGDEVKRRIMLGTYALSAGYYDAFYLKALRVRSLVLKDFEKAFEKFDVLVTPTTPSVSFKIGEKIDDPLAMYLNDICTIPVNLAGLPGISVPCGLSGGLPVGLHFIGPAFGEEIILKAAHAFEQNSEQVRLNL